MALRVGMIGYGWMGRAHTNALNKLPIFFPEVPETERRVLVGRWEDQLRAAADRLGFVEIATDWESTLDDIDVLVNIGPNFLHAEPSIAALERDIHVLCEKPLATSSDEAERMQAAAADSDAVAGVGFNYRYVPAIQYAKELIDGGELGELRHFRGSYLSGHLAGRPDAGWSWRHSREKAGAGALGDLGAHTIDLARFLVGDVETVQGHCRTFVAERPVTWEDDEPREVDVDDAYAANIEFEDGTMGTLEASRHACGESNNHAIEVHGTKGSVKFTLNRLNELQVNRDGDEGYETILVNGDEHPYGDRWWPTAHNIGWEHTFVHEHAEFLTAVDSDASYAPDFEDGARVQRLIDAIQRSDETGQRLRL
jgi:predicted dehydrogenase